MAFLLFWRFPRLPSAQGKAGEVSVVVPARNEEGNLPRLLASLARQHHPPLEIIVVDDNSSDRTPQVAEQGGAEVLRGQPLPAGWLGKPWACWQGAMRARGRILLFLDADTHLEAGALDAISAAVDRTDGLVSLWPYHRMRQLYERLGAHFHLVVMASVRVFSAFGRSSPAIGAFGPCVACSRESYVAVDGHRGVAGEILEDVVLGRRFRERGFPVSLFVGRGTVSFRMYPGGMGALVEGFGKNMGSGAGTTPAVVLALFVLWITGSSMTYYYAAQSLLTGALNLWLPLALAYMAQLFFVLRQLGNYTVLTAIFYPLSVVFFGLVALLSLVRTFVVKSVSWKGRTIEIRREKRDV
jgi:4,4'-diaponeurosporenoate glycosyltransferase